ncbi:MAG: hypothetical protein ACKVSF_03350 [Alphaproteobacteria bacterium]
MIQPGTKVRTLYQHSATGTIRKPGKVSLPMPGPDWYIIQFDDSGGKLCIHRSMFSISNEQ